MRRKGKKKGGEGKWERREERGSYLLKIFDKQAFYLGQPIFLEEFKKKKRNNMKEKK